MRKFLYFIFLVMFCSIAFVGDKDDVRVIKVFGGDASGYSSLAVDLRDDVTEEDIVEIEEQIGADLISVSEESFEKHRLMVVHLANYEIRRIVLEALKQDSRVEFAEPNHSYSVLPETDGHVGVSVEDPYIGPRELCEPNDPMYKYQWHMRMINAQKAWELADGKGSVVAVIDTGVTHSGMVVEDLAGATFVHPFNFITNQPEANDDHGHGTHVAGTIAQLTNNSLGVAGVAPKATIMPLKVLSRSGSGTVASIAAAIRFAADNGADVINMSLGGPFPSEIMQSAVTYAHSKGVIVVCAAGNSGPRGNSVGYPAACEHAVAVSSVDSVGNLAWYSSWGKQVDIAAPGGDTRSDRNGDGKPDGVLQNTIVPADLKNPARYELFQGTSMASPHVAGVAALIVQSGVKKDPDKVLKIMQDTSVKKDNAEKYGSGVVDALASVKQAKSSGFFGWLW